MRWIILMGWLLLAFSAIGQYSTNDNNLRRARTAFDAKNYEEAGKYFETFVDNEGVNVSTGRQMNVLNSCLYGAVSYERANMLNKVIPLYERGIGWARKLNDNEGLSIMLNNVALQYQRIGRFDKAIAAQKESLTLDEQQQKWKSVALDYSNMGLSYQKWGDYEKAMEHFQKSHDIHQELGDAYKAALRQESMGEIYWEWGEIDEASGRLNFALNTLRSYNGNPASTLITLAEIDIQQGKFDDARNKIKEAITLGKANQDEPALAEHLHALGKLDLKEGQAAYAKNPLAEALAYARFHKEMKTAAEILTTNGRVHKALGEYHDAIKVLEEAVGITQDLRSNAHGGIRRDFLASQIDIYKLLAQCYFKIGDLEKTYSTIELSRAQYLVEQMESADQIQPPSVSTVQNNLQKDEVVLIYANANWREKILLVITKDDLEGFQLNDRDFLLKVAKLSAQHSEQTINKQRGFLKVVEEKKEEPVITPQYKKDWELFELSINLYRYYLTNLMDESDLSQAFYELLIKPAEALMKKKDQVIIVPDGLLNYMPYETLSSSKKEYLIESFDVSYVQSMTVLDFLKSRNYSASRDFMLAFGGAVYNQNTYREDMGIPSSEKLPNEDVFVPMSFGDFSISTGTNAPISAQTNFNSINSRIEQTGDDSMSKLYEQVGVGTMINLPGTLAEIEGIKALGTSITTYTGFMASEANLKKEAKSGAIGNYRVLHFATHGLTMPEVPSLSAVVLSQFDPERSEDGYLRTDEINKLGLKADFVNLSACETGLGKIYGGEGVVGLTQSFLIAGANSLSVSLWSVADNSTSVFMQTMYKKVIKDNMTFEDAMAEVKREYINGNTSGKWSEPYYWAPFVYYGK